MFAYFSDGFPHVTKETKLSEKEMSLRNLGYLGWDEETAYSDIWINRLTKIWTLWDRANRTVDGEKKTLENCENAKAHGIVNEEEYEILSFTPSPLSSNPQAPCPCHRVRWRGR